MCKLYCAKVTRCPAYIPLFHGKIAMLLVHFQPNFYVEIILNPPVPPTFSTHFRSLMFFDPQEGYMAPMQMAPMAPPMASAPGGGSTVNIRIGAGGDIGEYQYITMLHYITIEGYRIFDTRALLYYAILLGFDTPILFG